MGPDPPRGIRAIFAGCLAQSTREYLQCLASQICFMISSALQIQMGKNWSGYIGLQM